MSKLEVALMGPNVYAASVGDLGQLWTSAISVDEHQEETDGAMLQDGLDLSVVPEERADREGDNYSHRPREVRPDLSAKDTQAAA